MIGRKHWTEIGKLSNIYCPRQRRLKNGHQIVESNLRAHVLPKHVQRVQCCNPVTTGNNGSRVGPASPLSPDDITVEEVLSAGNGGGKTICLQNIGQRFVCKTRWLVRWLSPAHVSRCTGWINEINENTNTGKLCDSKRRGVSEQVPWIWSHPYDRFGEP